MAKSLSYTPDPILFLSEGVYYLIAERVSAGSSDAPINLSFEIGYRAETSAYASEIIDVMVCAVPRRRTGISYYHWNCDLTDLIAAYARRLFVSGGYIEGYASVQLIEIDGEEVEDDEHICLFGTSGGLEFDETLSANRHPFLLARSNDEGCLHFYRSELKAMDYLYAIKPDDYDNIYFDTDNYKYPQRELDENSYTIRNRSEILGIHYYEGDIDSQYDVTSADVIFVHLTKNSADVLVYAIAVQDDPETDEAYLIRWTNSMGAPEALLLTGEMRDISEAGQPDIYIHEQEYGRTQRKLQRSMITAKYTLQTGYLTPGRISALSDMLNSEEVELMIDGQWVPVSVTADAKHAVHQREPENFELTLEALEQTRYRKPDRNVKPIADPDAILRDKDNNAITDNNSNILY